MGATLQPLAPAAAWTGEVIGEAAYFHRTHPAGPAAPRFEEQPGPAIRTRVLDVHGGDRAPLLAAVEEVMGGRAYALYTAIHDVELDGFDGRTALGRMRIAGPWARAEQAEAQDPALVITWGEVGFRHLPSLRGLLEFMAYLLR